MGSGDRVECVRKKEKSVGARSGAAGACKWEERVSWFQWVASGLSDEAVMPRGVEHSIANPTTGSLCARRTKR